ncbi:MAG: hypothetical protein WKF75_03375 [Singulisphaera sp.]
MRVGRSAALAVVGAAWAAFGGRDGLARPGPEAWGSQGTAATTIGPSAAVDHVADLGGTVRIGKGRYAMQRSWDSATA